jgi:hypothetical protein
MKTTLLIICIYSNFVFSQLMDKGDDFKSRLYISISYTPSFGGPEKQIEEVMRSSGFDETEFNWFSGENITHPKTELDKLPYKFDILYRINELLFVGIQFNNSIAKETSGYANPQGGFGQYLFLSYSAKIFAPIIEYSILEVINLGIGPSYNSLNCSDNSSSEYYNPDQGKYSTEKIGFLTYIKFRIELSNTFFVNLLLQYNYIGKIPIGPYIKEDTIGIATNPTTVILTFRRTEVNYNNTSIGLGIGISL